MQIEKKGSGPWPGVKVDGVNVTFTAEGKAPLALDCNALQKDWQVVLDVVRGHDGGIVVGAANGTAYVANLIIPPARYHDVPLVKTVAEAPLPEGLDPEYIQPEPTTESVRVPLASEDMESVRLILWTVNTQEA